MINTDKLKKTLAICLAAASILSMSACSKTSSETKDPTDTPEPTVEVTPTPAPTADPLLSAEFIPERFAEQLGECEYYDDAAGSELARKVVFRAQETVTAVKYLELSGADNKEGTVLYSLDKLTPDMTLMINIVIEGLVPDRAIAYTDGSGSTHIFCITESGEDNVPVLVNDDSITVSEKQQISDNSGPETAKIVNPRGDTTTVYKLADGRYMDRTDNVFTYDGAGAWTDANGVEWNEAVE